MFAVVWLPSLPRRLHCNALKNTRLFAADVEMDVETRIALFQGVGADVHDLSDDIQRHRQAAKTSGNE